MKNLVLLIVCLIISINGISQYVVKGKITDQNGEAVPGARIYLENTTYGVITNVKGDYFLELKHKSTYPIAFSMIGMKDTLIQLQISDKVTVLNMTLVEYSKELETVEVSAKKINIAKLVIKNVQGNRKLMANQFKNYSCNTYLKTGLEKERRYKQKYLEDVDSVISQPSKMNFVESYSLSKFKAPNQYQENILAHHDYAEKSSNNVSGSVSFDMGDDIAPVQDIETNPYIFFEKIEDGDFNLYQNMINLPKVSEHPIVSPIGANAFANYKYKLKTIFYENGQKIYQISVIPKFKMAALFEGSLFIIDQEWVVKSFDLKINSSAMPFFNDFTVLQDYEKINNFWVPTRREYIYTITEGKDLISANTRVNHSNYKFNLTLNKKDFNNEILAYQPDAFDKDSSYWSNMRPIQLKTEELDFIQKQDSIEDHLQSEAYLDSIDRDYNKITFWDVTLNGIGFRNRSKNQSIRFGSLLNSVKLFGIGGFRLGNSVDYTKKFENAHKLVLSGALDYGFNNKDLKWEAGIKYTFLPKRFGSVELEFGDVYDLITNYNSVLGTFSRGNYVRKRFVGVGHSIEIINGLYGSANFSYSDREAITNLSLSKWSEKLFGELNEPQPFDRYKISMLEVQFLYRFKQKYIIKKMRN